MIVFSRSISGPSTVEKLGGEFKIGGGVGSASLTGVLRFPQSILNELAAVGLFDRARLDEVDDLRAILLDAQVHLLRLQELADEETHHYAHQKQPVVHPGASPEPQGTS